MVGHLRLFTPHTRTERTSAVDLESFGAVIQDLPEMPVFCEQNVSAQQSIRDSMHRDASPEISGLSVQGIDHHAPNRRRQKFRMS